MPSGPKGERSLADGIGAVIIVAKIATGENEATTGDAKSKAAIEVGRKGGKAPAEKMRPEEPGEIARKAA